jgi:hypothetical protein
VPWCRSWQMTFCDTAGSRIPGRSWQRSHDCHARQIGHRARLPAIRKLPAASPCCIPAQHATTRPYLPCQRVPRRPGRSRCTRPQTPSAMSKPLQRKFNESARKRQPSIHNDPNRSHSIYQSCTARATASAKQGLGFRVPSSPPGADRAWRFGFQASTGLSAMRLISWRCGCAMDDVGRVGLLVYRRNGAG